MNCLDGFLLIIELHTRSVLISVTDSNGSGSVSSTGARYMYQYLLSDDDHDDNHETYRLQDDEDDDHAHSRHLLLLGGGAPRAISSTCRGWC